MKKLHTAANLLQVFILIGILAACNHDQAIAPVSKDEIAVNDRNAKITPLTRLTKEGDVNIQYIKAGKFLGKVSKLFTGPNDSFNYEYTYNDNNPAGVLWINRKQIKKSDGMVTNIVTYKVIGGFCDSSTGSDGGFYKYLYTPQGQLSQVNKFKNSFKVETVNFSYNYVAATNSYRLHSLTELGGSDFQLTYTYTSITDKYASRNPLVGLPTSLEHGNMDAHLPIFGKFSDVLVDVMVGQFLSGPVVPHTYKSTYVTDSDGLVTVSVP